MGISPAQPCSQITIRFVICLPVKQNLNDLNCPISAPSNDWIGFGLMQISGGRRSVPEVGRKSVPEVGRSSVSEVGRCQRSVGVKGRSASKVGRCQSSVGAVGVSRVGDRPVSGFGVSVGRRSVSGRSAGCRFSVRIRLLQVTLALARPCAHPPSHARSVPCPSLSPSEVEEILVEVGGRLRER